MRAIDVNVVAAGRSVMTARTHLAMFMDETSDFRPDGASASRQIMLTSASEIHDYRETESHP